MELGRTGGRHGVLTHFLLRTLEAASADTTYQDAVDSVILELDGYVRELPPDERIGPIQEPQLEGVRDREIFGRCEIPTMRYVKVEERLDDGEVRLAGGAAHRIRRGGEIEVYPRGTRRAVSESDGLGGEEASVGAHAPIGRVLITAVREVKSSARILTEAGDRPIQAGDRALLREQKWEDLVLTVRLEVPPAYDREATELRARIESSPLMRLAEVGEETDLAVLVLPPRELAETEDPLPSLGGIEVATWAMTRDRGTLRAPLHPLREREAVGKVFRNLEKWARWQVLFEFENSDSPLTGEVDLVLLRNRDGRWESAAKEGEDPVFRAGERFAFEITNRHSAPVFAYVLDLGFGGGIGPLYPVMTGAWEPLKPGRSVEVGTERETCRFYAPREYPYHPGSKPSDGLEREVLKMIVTTEKTDFRIFFQEGYREPGLLRPEYQHSELGRILSFVSFGLPLRGEGEPEPAAVGEWTTVECPLWVRS